MAKNVYDAPFFYPPVPPKGDTTPPVLPDKEIWLYENSEWSGDPKLKISISAADRIEGRVFSFSGSANDNITWIAFNLAEGVVCTLSEHTYSPDPSSPFSLRNAGKSVDLIGTGRTQYVDLKAYGANDILSAGIWRYVDADDGWIQLFEYDDCEGRFVSLFASEWLSKNAIDLKGWHLQDRASSVNYPMLSPPQNIALYENVGEGRTIWLGATNPFGEPNPLEAQKNFQGEGLNDKISSFHFSYVQPVLTRFDPVIKPYSFEPTQTNTLSQTIVDYNRDDGEEELVVEWDLERSIEVSATTSVEYAAEIQVAATVEVSSGASEANYVKGSVTTSFTASRAEGSSKTHTDGTVTKLSGTAKKGVPGRMKATFYVSLSYATLQRETFELNGYFYYKQNLPGSVYDSQEGLWKLSYPMKVAIFGQVASNVVIDEGFDPLST